MALMDDIRKVLVRMVEPLRNRVYNIVSRAVLEAVKDDGKMQFVKVNVLAGESRDDIEHMQEYGFTSRALPGAEAIILCPQGNRDHMIAVTVGDRTVRLQGLEEGEVAIYSDEGDKIHFKRGNILQIESPNVILGKGVQEKILNGEAFQTRFNNHRHAGNLATPTGVPLDQSDDDDLSDIVTAATEAEEE